MQALAVEQVESSFFNDPRRFPSGSVEFDCALLMRGIRHEWRALGRFAESLHGSARHQFDSTASLEQS
jgi:hypothetical protein